MHLLSTLTTLSISLSLPLLTTAQQCTTISSVTHTFYGYPDNDPPGPGTAYDCGRGYVAGGTGTYDDPLTFATADGEFDVCEIIYDPYTRKYLRHEDLCAQCTTDWEQSGTWHIDVWTGSASVNGGQDQIDCEDELTPEAQSIVRYPGTGLDVDTTELYVSGANPSCRTSHVYPDYDIGDYC